MWTPVAHTTCMGYKLRIKIRTLKHPSATHTSHQFMDIVLKLRYISTRVREIERQHNKIHWAMQRARNDNKKRPTGHFPFKIYLGIIWRYIINSVPCLNCIATWLSSWERVFMEWMLRGSHLFMCAPDTFYIFHVHALGDMVKALWSTCNNNSMLSAFSFARHPAVINYWWHVNSRCAVFCRARKAAWNESLVGPE